MIFSVTVLGFNGINWCFEACRAKFHVGVVLSVELWSFLCKNPIFLVFSDSQRLV